MRGNDQAQPRLRHRTRLCPPLVVLCAVVLAPLFGCSEEYPIGRYTDSDSETDAAVDTDPSGDTEGMNTSLSGTTTATSGGTSGLTTSGGTSGLTTSGGTSGLATAATDDATGLHATTTAAVDESAPEPAPDDG